MYFKTIADFIQAADKKSIQESIINILSNEIAGDIQKNELDSWNNSLPALALFFQKLPKEIKNNVEVILEASYSIENNRADVVLVGTKNKKPAMMIIENKIWDNISNYVPFGETALVNMAKQSEHWIHPCYQVEHYKYVLKNTNKFVQENNVQINTAVFMQTTDEDRKTKQGVFVVN